MEIIAAIIVIVGLCLCLGVPTGMMLLGAAAVLGILVALMLIMFTFSLICLLLSKKTEAEFIRTEKRPNGKFESAVYRIGQEEFFCMFPSEMIFKKKLYPSGKICTVRLNRRMKCVFDGFAAATCLIGFIFCALFTGAVVFILIYSEII